MRESRMLMGMPITVEIADTDAKASAIELVFAYLRGVDERFSTYKPTSEISMLNDGRIRLDDCSAEMRGVLALCDETSRLTGGFFDITGRDGRRDPSGLVKGWMIRAAADLLGSLGYKHYYVDAGGDIQVRGTNAAGQPLTVGIRDPFGSTGMVKVLLLTDAGIATSGTYLRGQHIYDPRRKDDLITDIVSLTVIGPDVYEADRFATAAFAMGRDGIAFIGRTVGLEGYLVDAAGTATMTAGFSRYVIDAPAYA